ncbi:hypothetical protein MKX08_007502, partial [Trichoderma sp. CBMAI-0020]
MMMLGQSRTRNSDIGNACIRCGIHYLDISAKLINHQLADQKNNEAEAANFMPSPVNGGSVTFLGCLAGHAVKRVKKVSSIDIALFVAGKCRALSLTLTMGKVALPDLLNIWKSTKSPNIKAFVHVSGDAFAIGELTDRLNGPTMEQTNGYDFTSVACIKAGKKVLDGKAKGGFQTPAIIFGGGFVTTILGSTLEDMLN